MEIRRNDLSSKIKYYNEKLLKEHETAVHHKNCLCPEFQLGMKEIKRRLEYYNYVLSSLYTEFIINRKGSEDVKAIKNIKQVTKELEEFIPCISGTVLLSYLSSLVDDASFFVQLIFYHVLAKLKHPGREKPFNNNEINNKYQYHISLNMIFYSFYEDTNPEVSFDLIHEVWKYHPSIEFKLRLICCESLDENKHEILDQLIKNNEDYFLSLPKKCKRDLAGYIFDENEYGTHLTILLILLCNFAITRQMAKVKTVLMHIKHIICVSTHFSNTDHLYIKNGFNGFPFLTLRKTQLRMIPSLIKVLMNRPDLHYVSLEIVYICNARLLNFNRHEMSMDFIKDNCDFILNVPFFSEETECYARQKYCKLLLTLLHAYVMCEDLTNMNNVLNSLQVFRQSLLSSTYKSCACFMGKHDCIGNVPLFGPYEDEQYMYYNTFEDFESSSLAHTLNDIKDKVLKQELRSDCYLKCMINGIENTLKIREDLREEFILFIKQISVHNETELYNIIKTLCVLKMQPEIQNMFIQGLTDYMHVKCNKQNSIYLSLLLDINMTCYEGEFLKKLTINMGKILRLEEDTVNDVEKIIYRCFCIVRHENKVNVFKDSNIEKYKNHFCFIPTMEADEDMKKLSHLRSFLVMLILIIISSGGLHKSAKLKKYLSLKYAYEDAILYLLWCSGDVEINPGPTMKKLEKGADSVKKRNWIHDICTTALKLLKKKALDSKSDGLWKEKPDSWQELHADKPFYDPRNKPKSEQLSIEDDKKLMNCLLKSCDGKNIPLPSNFQTEITAWEEDDSKLLLELCVTRWVIEAMKMAKDLLIKYADTPEFKKYMKDCYVDLSFNPNSTQKDSPKGYSDVVRDLAITFCRVSKSLPIFKKSDGIWKTKPHDWNPNHLYYSPCNTGKRQEKHQDQKLVDNLLVYCERKSISIPAELQLVANAWKLGNSHDICKHYTIWSSMAIIQHSLKYLEIEGLLEKPHVQQSLKQIGVSLHCEKSPNQHNNDSIINTDNESKVSGLPNNSLSANQIGTKSSSPLCSASDSDMVCSQHAYEADAITNSHTTKYVITCQKHDFINQPSTSGCTIYSKTAHCQKRRVDLQSRDVRDLNDSHKSLSEISHQKHDFQLSSFGCSSFTKRAHCLMASDDLPSKDERIQKRKRTISEDRLEKRSRLHLENESQASTSSITRCNGVTTPSSHCDSDILDQDVHSSNTEEEVDQDQSSNRIPVPDNIQNTDSSNTQLSSSGDEIPKHLLQYIDTYMSRDDLEKNLGEDLEQIDIQLKLWETS